MLDGIRTRGTDEPGAIQSRATNLTVFSGVAAAVAAGATVFNDGVTKIFGEDVADSTKAAVLISIIAAWTLIAVADLLARSRAAVPSKTMQSLVSCLSTEDGRALLERVAPAAPSPEWQPVAVPAGLRATVTEGRDEDGFLVAAIRHRQGDDGSVEFLLVKDDRAPRWYPAASVEPVHQRTRGGHPLDALTSAV